MLNKTCSNCGAPMDEAWPHCPVCCAPVIVTAAVVAPLEEQRHDTRLVGGGLIALGALVSLGGLATILLTFAETGFPLEWLGVTIAAVAIVFGVSLALFLAGSVVIAAGRDRKGTVAGTVAATGLAVLSTFLSVAALIVSVVVAILLALLALLAAIWETCTGVR